MFAYSSQTCHCIWAGLVLPGPQVRLNEGKGVRKLCLSHVLRERELTVKFGRVSANTKPRDRNKIVNRNEFDGSRMVIQEVPQTALEHQG